MNISLIYSSPMKQGKTQATRPANRLFYDAFVASPIGIAVEDLEGRLLFVNPALCTLLGFSEEEMRKKHCVEFSPPEDAEKDWACFEHCERVRSTAISWTSVFSGETAPSSGGA